MAGLAKQTIRGFFWSLSEKTLTRGIQALSTLFLAYFLSPDDFGLIAMLMIFINIAGLVMDCGFTQALIRQEKYNSLDFNTAFYANLVLGAGAYMLLFFSAPYIARFYDEESLTLLSRVVGLVIISNSFQVVQIAKLSRDLNFRVQFRAVVPSSLFSVLIALIMAYKGLGVWALVSQMLSASILVSIILWLQRVWRPSGNISSESFSRLYGFGYKLLLSGIFAILLNNAYLVVIGKFFSASAAGLYFFADKIKDATLTQLVTSVQKVTYPALSTIQSDDERLRAGYSRVVRLSTYVVFPLVAITVSQAQTIFEWLLPEKWWPASIYFQLIFLANILLPLHVINLNILLIKGRSDLFLKLEIIKVCMTLIALALSYDYGVMGILVAQNLLSIVSYVINAFYSSYLIDYSIKDQLLDFLPNLFLTFFVTSTLIFLRVLADWPTVLEMSVFVVFALILYLCLSRVFKLNSYEDLKSILIKR